VVALHSSVYPIFCFSIAFLPTRDAVFREVYKVAHHEKARSHYILPDRFFALRPDALDSETNFARAETFSRSRSYSAHGLELLEQVRLQRQR
jgi:hypothetical protein